MSNFSGAIGFTACVLLRSFLGKRILDGRLVSIHYGFWTSQIRPEFLQREYSTASNSLLGLHAQCERSLSIAHQFKGQVPSRMAQLRSEPQSIYLLRMSPQDLECKLDQLQLKVGSSSRCKNRIASSIKRKSLVPKGVRLERSRNNRP
ncbi:hypothetical protein Tco_1176370 [Tanacetum coccineum]